MKKFYIIFILFLYSEILDAKTTNLSCKVDGKTYSIIVDDENKKVTWLDKIVEAKFSATTVNFIVHNEEHKPGSGVYVVISYSISRENLGIVQTVSMITPILDSNETLDKKTGICEIGKKIETKF